MIYCNICICIISRYTYDKGDIMAIKEYTIKTLADYMACINTLRVDNEVLWYRGHADEKYLLQPTIYRAPYTWEKEKSFMNEFKAKATKFIKAKDDYFEWLFIMQHHGTPTRLLDWSENALVAIAFATQYRKDEHSGKNAVVWCLNPIKFNEPVHFGNCEEEPIPNIIENTTVQQMYTNSARTKRPIAILGSYNNERIIAQKGVFTLFPEQPSFSIDSLNDAEKYLTKIIIQDNCVDEIAKELYFIGLNELSLFPGLESISKEIIRKSK